MKTHSEQWNIGEMARVLGVSRSGYYRHLLSKSSRRAEENAKLLSVMPGIFKASRETYGSPRMHAELVSQGFCCSRPRVARLMQKAGLAAKMPRLFKRTTRVNEKRPVAPNLLGQDFKAQLPNQKWVSDISYVQTKEGWWYIAAILDLFSRKIVGLSMGSSLHTPLVLTALNQALKRRGKQADLQHHSARGSQYTSQDFQKALQDNGITCSMSAAGYCYDNAAMESFFHTLKTECVYFERYENRAEAKKSIFEYVEVFYNNRRRHSTLGYLAPAEFERRYYQ